jgi:Amt family ammonium transporter
MASVLIVMAYSGAATFAILKALALVLPLRISPRVEGVGMDVTEHGEEAYTGGDGAILVSPKETHLRATAAEAVALQSGGQS